MFKKLYVSPEEKNNQDQLRKRMFKFLESTPVNRVKIALEMKIGPDTLNKFVKYNGYIRQDAAFRIKKFLDSKDVDAKI